MAAASNQVSGGAGDEAAGGGGLSDSVSTGYGGQ